MWNERDDRVPWVAKLSEITSAGVAHFGRARPPVLPPLGAVEHHEVDWRNPMTPAGLIDMVSSRSYVLVAEPAQRDQIIGGVRELLADDPELAGREQFELPYVTRCTRARVIR